MKRIVLSLLLSAMAVTVNAAGVTRADQGL